MMMIIIIMLIIIVIIIIIIIIVIIGAESYTRSYESNRGYSGDVKTWLE